MPEPATTARMNAGNPMVPRRWVPDAPFPPYAYVPKQFPHPNRDPGGHRYGATIGDIATFDPGDWRKCRPYLLGIDLFNFGYYWEAHEAWERVWHAAGRTGATADLVRGLIHLAAAGFKVRERMPNGARRHGRHAADLFCPEAEANAAAGSACLGLPRTELCAFAVAVARGLRLCPVPADARVAAVFDFVLCPG